MCTVYRHGDDPRDVWYRVDDVEKALGAETISQALTRRTWSDLVRRYNASLHGLSYHVRDHQVFAPTMFVSAHELDTQCSGLRFEVISSSAGRTLR